jgi:pectate lyase
MQQHIGSTEYHSMKGHASLVALLVLLVPACGSSTGAGQGAGGSNDGGGSAMTGQGGVAGGVAGSAPGTGGVAGSTASGSGGTRDAGTVVRDAAVPPSADGGCTLPPQDTPVGWATVAGMGVNTVTGGGNAAPVIVTTLAAFTARAAGTGAAVLQVVGTISGSMKVGSNKTILGGCGATIQGHLELSASSNVIVRNLALVGNNCTDNPTDCSAGADTISVSNGAHHLWFDHDDISDGSDGNLDINQASDFITISWTKFHYSAPRVDPAGAGGGHEFSNLVSSSDTDTGDIGHLHITWHHNWWADNVHERMPRARFGQLHIYNNLYTSAGDLYCIGAGVGVNIRDENNVFVGVAKPVDTTSFSDPTTIVQSINNIYTRTTGGLPQDIGTAFTPPYTYAPDDPTTVQAAVMAGVGPQ